MKSALPPPRLPAGRLRHGDRLVAASGLAAIAGLVFGSVVLLALARQDAAWRWLDSTWTRDDQGCLTRSWRDPVTGQAAPLAMPPHLVAGAAPCGAAVEP